MLNRCLDGGYVNFGVFSLYNDRALDAALDTSLKLVLPIPLSEVMVSVHPSLFVALVSMSPS